MITIPRAELKKIPGSVTATFIPLNIMIARQFQRGKLFPPPAREKAWRFSLKFCHISNCW
jgi:hypothetical protein